MATQSALVGSEIKWITPIPNEDTNELKFRTNDWRKEVSWRIDADCCSTGYFTDILGDDPLKIGTVQRVEELSMTDKAMDPAGFP